MDARARSALEACDLSLAPQLPTGSHTDSTHLKPVLLSPCVVCLLPQDTLADAERSFLSFATPIFTFCQDTTYKVFSVTDSFVSAVAVLPVPSQRALQATVAAPAAVALAAGEGSATLPMRAAL